MLSYVNVGNLSMLLIVQLFYEKIDFNAVLAQAAWWSSNFCDYCLEFNAVALNFEYIVVFWPWRGCGWFCVLLRVWSSRLRV
jgi:hypothetical protein